jgi:hypothetical protein
MVLYWRMPSIVRMVLVRLETLGRLGWMRMGPPAVVEVEPTMSNQTEVKACTGGQ